MSFSATRYLKVTFPDYLPPSATVTSAQLVHTYRPKTAAHDRLLLLRRPPGRDGARDLRQRRRPVLRDRRGVHDEHDPDAALNTAARVNGAIIRMYVRTSAAGRTLHDLFRLDVGYSVD